MLKSRIEISHWKDILCYFEQYKRRIMKIFLWDGVLNVFSYWKVHVSRKI